MTVEEAQLEVRSVFMGGLIGQLVSGMLWLSSAAVATWDLPGRGIAILCLGGALIFPVTQLVLRAMGRPATLRANNPLRYLAMQIAFTIPLGLPLVGAATLYRLNWFYPASMVVVGAHYLPFVFLYGMRHFAVLCSLMVGGGVLLGLYRQDTFSTGGWLTGALLVLFGFVGGFLARREEPGTRSAA
jgi:uncharacterized protein DUF7010